MDAITSKLYKEFGDGYEIYTEHIEQGFNKPCFFIAFENSKIGRMLGNRFLQENKFCIKYYCDENNKNFHYNEMATDLFFAMEYITLSDGSTIASRDFQFSVEDGVLHMFVHFNTEIIKEETKTIMGNLDSFTKLQ